MSPRKVRLLVDAVRGLRASEALIQLQFSGTMAARPIAKLIQSGMANAEHNHGLSKESLVIVRAAVDGGPIMYRFTPRAMGRSAPIRKRTSHITIVLAGELAESKVKEKKDDVKEKKELPEEAIEKKPVRKSTSKKSHEATTS